MRLIAKRPCNFGGKQFFIGEEIPKELVTNVKQLQKFGVITVIPDAIFEETETNESAVVITVYVDGNEDTALLLSQEEVQEVFTIMQKTADDGVKAIAEVQSENVLILLHAADSRKTIKEAAKKQADNLFSTKEDLNESSNGNDITGTNTEGADT